MTRTLLALFTATALSGLLAQEPVRFTNGDLRAEFGIRAGDLANDGHFLTFLPNDVRYPLLFQLGFVMSGFDAEDNLKTYGVFDRIGRMSLMGVEDSIRQPWRVTIDDVTGHLADFADNGVIDAPIDAIFAWPARGNPFFAQYNGYAPPTDERVLLADFVDVNGDGSYDPSQGDYPHHFIRGCVDADASTFPTELLVFPYRLIPAPGQNLEEGQVNLTALRFGCEDEENAINNSIYLDYRSIYLPPEGDDAPLRDVYMGLHIDGDVGCFLDDYVGYFPDRQAVYFYNADETDVNCPTGNSIGLNPPMIALDYLSGPVDQMGTPLGLSHLMPFNNPAVVPPQPPGTTDYTTPDELRNYLTGRWRDGNPLLDEGFGYGSGGEPIDFAFGGNPLTGEGWSEYGEGNLRGDRRAMMSSGPFDLEPGAINEYVMSISYVYRPEVGYLEQLDELADRIDILQALYDNCLVLDDADFGCQAVTTPTREAAGPAATLEVYPNPAREAVSVVTSATEPGMLYVYTATGSLLLQKRTNSEITTLDCRAWPAGLYLLRWEGARGTYPKITYGLIK